MSRFPTSDEPRSEPLPALEDGRGALYKLFPWPVPGEVYAVHVRAGASRGHHLHRRAAECFAGLQGRALLVLRGPSGERRVLPLLGRRVLVPPGWAHAVFAPADQDCLLVAAMDHPHVPADVFPTRLEAP